MGRPKSKDRDKVNKILALLKKKNRKEVARCLGYKSYKGLDMYMRRKNFVYDATKRQYVPAKQKEAVPSKDMPLKAAHIIAAFNHKNPDPLDIAKQEGFQDHRAMAAYMAQEGYGWHVGKENYTKNQDEEPFGEKFSGLQNAPDILLKEEYDLSKYVPFLAFVYERREKVYRWFSEEEERAHEIKRDGAQKALKAIWVKDEIAKQVALFSEERNVSEGEVVERALIAYLKAGWEKEAERR